MRPDVVHLGAAVCEGPPYQPAIEQPDLTYPGAAASEGPQAAGDSAARYCLPRGRGLRGPAHTTRDIATRSCLIRGGRLQGSARAAGETTTRSSPTRGGRSRGPTEASASGVAECRPSRGGRSRGPAPLAGDLESSQLSPRLCGHKSSPSGCPRIWQYWGRISPDCGRPFAKVRLGRGRQCGQMSSIPGWPLARTQPSSRRFSVHVWRMATWPTYAAGDSVVRSGRC